MGEGRMYELEVTKVLIVIIAWCRIWHALESCETNTGEKCDSKQVMSHKHALWKDIENIIGIGDRG